MQEWLIGLDQVFQWSNLLLLFLGVLIGLTFASLPGLNNITAMVLMMPFCFEMDPIPAMIFMAAIYGGGIHGGCILAILFRIPGEPQSVCTCFDGAPMAAQGKSGEALGIAFLFSSLGGLFGVIACIICAPILGRIALMFGPTDYFAFVFFGLCVASCVGATSPLRGLISACAGLMLSLVGVSPGSGVLRYTADIHILAMGIKYVPIIMGVFAIAELFKMVMEGKTAAEGEFTGSGVPTWMVNIPSLSFIRKAFKTYIRSSFVGTLIGFLPGAGATASSFVSYGLEQKYSKDPSSYGKGNPLGIVASETANNASYGGAMIPMLTMGIPGSSSTAVMLGILMLKGITPSPEVFMSMPNLVYSVFVAMVVINFIMFGESLFFGRLYLNLMKLPRSVICFIIVTFCVVGTFSLRSSIEDVWIMAIFGVIGYIMMKCDFPVASLVLGVILGDMAETSFIQSLDMAGSPNPLVFFSTPVSASLMIIGVLVLIWPVLKKIYGRRKAVAA